MASSIETARQRVVDVACHWRAGQVGVTPQDPELRDLVAAVDELLQVRSRAAIEAVQGRRADIRPTAWARVLEPAL